MHSEDEEAGGYDVEAPADQDDDLIVDLQLKAPSEDEEGARSCSVASDFRNLLAFSASLDYFSFSASPMVWGPHAVRRR